MVFDRFDIVSAWYLYLSHTHEGQGSVKYARLSRMLRWYRPAVTTSRERLTENARAVYDRLMSAGT